MINVFVHRFSSPAEKLAKRCFHSFRQRPLARAFALLERAELHQPDGGGKLRLVERRLQPADRIGLAETTGIPQNLLGQLGDLRDARAAAAKEHSRPQVIQQPGLLQVLAQ